MFPSDFSVWILTNFVVLCIFETQNRFSRKEICPSLEQKGRKIRKKRGKASKKWWILPSHTAHTHDEFPSPCDPMLGRISGPFSSVLPPTGDDFSGRNFSPGRTCKTGPRKTQWRGHTLMMRREGGGGSESFVSVVRGTKGTTLNVFMCIPHHWVPRSWGLPSPPPL